MALEPVDLNRCRAEIKEGSFMTLGPRKFVRCNSIPKYIALENVPGPDGLKGSMSLCEPCSEMLKKKLGENFCTLQEIKNNE